MPTQRRILRILGLGQSLHEVRPDPEPDVEVWGLQYTWTSHKIHKLFMMDDREWIVSKNNTRGRNIQKEINDLNIPVITSKLWGDLERNEEYPLEHVLSIFPNLRHKTLKKTERGEEPDEIRGDYMMNTFCYMLALAIFEGYERIEIYGMDMSNSKGRERTKELKELAETDLEQVMDRLHVLETWEDERTCVAYWVGVAVGRGIEVVLSRGARVTKPVHEENPNLYGYKTSKSLQEVRDEILNQNKNYEKKVASGNVEVMPDGTRVIDMTDKKLNLSFYRKEDWPKGTKPGDTGSPRNNPYHTTNETKTDVQSVDAESAN